MKTVFFVIASAAIGFLAGIRTARAQGQSFSWHVTGTGIETWYTDDPVYSVIQLTTNSPQPGVEGIFIAGTNKTAVINGSASFSFDISWTSAAWAGGEVKIRDVTDNRTIIDVQGGNFVFNSPFPGGTNSSGYFAIVSGHTYSFSAVADGSPPLPGHDGFGSGSCSLNINFPDHTDHNVHTASRTQSMPGNGLVSSLDGEKNLGGFDALPQPQNGGTISGVSYAIGCDNPHVLMFFSDTRSQSTANQNANVIAMILPVPLEVTGLSFVSNIPAKDGSATMIWSWSPALYATGYHVSLAEFRNGVWQKPQTNFTSSTSYTFTGVTPGVPCEIRFYATNVNGTGPSSVPCWPTAATAPIPLKVTGMMLTSNSPAKDGTATMTWTWGSADFAAGYLASIAEYRNGAWQIPLSNYVSGTSFTFTHITPGVPCEIRVYGTNVAEVGPSSDPCWPTASSVPLPAKIANMALRNNYATSRTNCTMTWTWSPSDYAFNYRVVLAQYLDGIWQPAATNYTFDNIFTFSGLTPGAPCEVLVSGINVTGTGPSCDPCWPVADAPNIAPRLVDLSIGPGSMSLNGVGFYRQILVVEICTNLSTQIWLPAQTNILNASGKLNFSKPFTAQDPSCFYRLVLIPDAPVGAPGTPTITGNAVVSPSYDIVSVGFTPADGATSSQIIYQLHNGTTWIGPWTNTASTSAGSFNVPPGTMFKVAAQGINSGGIGPVSAYITNLAANYSLPSTPLTAPVVIANVPIDAAYSSVTVSNGVVPGASSGQLIYQVHNGITWVGPWTNSSSLTSGSFNVPPGTMFKVATRGINVIGAGGFSEYQTNIASAFVPPNSAPGLPVVMENNCINSNYSTVKVGFSPAQGADKCQIIYQVYNGATWIGPWTNSATSDSGAFNVPPGMIFKVAAQGKNNVGLGPMSEFTTNISAAYIQ